MANLAHSGSNEMAENKLDVDVVVGQLPCEGVAPLLEESLAARVGSQERGRSPAAEGAHSQDKAALLALLHDGGDGLGSPQSTDAVDGDDSLELLLGSLEEGDRDAVALADVVDQDGDVKILDKVLQSLVVGVVVLGEVHGQRLDLNLLSGILGLDLLGEGIEFRLGSGDEDEVEALGGELGGIFLAEAIAGAGDDDPRARLSVLAELRREYS